MGQRHDFGILEGVPKPATVGSEILVARALQTAIDDVAVESGPPIL